MEKIKIGYLPMYIKLYDDSNPNYRDPMVEHMGMMVKMLESENIEVVLADVCRLKEEFEQAIRIFNQEDVAAVVTQHLAYSPSLEAIDALMRLRAPLIVLDTTPDYALVEAAPYEGRISVNHGIHGVQDMCNLLKQRGRSYHICAGHALHSDVISQTAGLCRAAAVKKAYERARVGLVGGAFEGMGDFSITPERFKDTIGAQVLNFEKDAIKEYLASITPEEIDAEVQWDRGRFTWEVEDETSYRQAVKSGLAIRRWAQDNALTACTVNFLTLDQCGLPKMPFVECSKMLTRGLGYAGEGDVLTAGLVGALISVYPGTTFTEMFCPDWKEDLVLLSHMGEVNLNLAQWKPVLRSVPFNYNSCGMTAAAYTCMRPGKAAFVNLAPMGEKFCLIVTPVDMLDLGLEFGAYRNTIQGWMKPAKPLRTFLKDYSMAGGTHHAVLVYDVKIPELLAFGEMMGFDTILID